MAEKSTTALFLMGRKLQSMATKSLTNHFAHLAISEKSLRQRIEAKVHRRELL
jgi:hypothetical protein